MAMRRAETIESKYDKAKRNRGGRQENQRVSELHRIYGGTEHSVTFDEQVAEKPMTRKQNRTNYSPKRLRTRKRLSYAYYLVNPDYLREHKYGLDIEIHPESQGHATATDSDV